MKKNEQAFCRDSADTVAVRMTKGMGKGRALSVAESLAKELIGISIADVNPDFFTSDNLRKSERFWVQVRNILRK